MTKISADDEYFLSTLWRTNAAKFVLLLNTERAQLLECFIYYSDLITVCQHSMGGYNSILGLSKCDVWLIFGRLLSSATELVCSL